MVRYLVSRKPCLKCKDRSTWLAGIVIAFFKKKIIIWDMEKITNPESKANVGIAELERVVGLLPSASIEMVAIRDFISIERANRLRDRKLEDLQLKDLTEGERVSNESDLRIAEQGIALAEHSKDGNASKPGYLRAFDQIEKKIKVLQKQLEAEEEDQARYMALNVLDGAVRRRLRAEDKALTSFYEEEPLSSQP